MRPARDLRHHAAIDGMFLELRQHDIGDDVVCHGDGNTVMVQLKRAAEVNGFLFQQGGLFVVKAEGSSYKWFEVRSKGGSVKAA